MFGVGGGQVFGCGGDQGWFRVSCRSAFEIALKRAQTKAETRERGGLGTSGQTAE